MKRTYEVVEENGVKSYRLEDVPQYALLYEELKEGLALAKGAIQRLRKKKQKSYGDLSINPLKFDWK